MGEKDSAAGLVELRFIEEVLGPESRREGVSGPFPFIKGSPANRSAVSQSLSSLKILPLQEKSKLVLFRLAKEMSSLGFLKSAIFQREERKQQYQAHIRGLNAYDRHKKFVKDYVDFYGKARNTHGVLPIKTDQDTLREGYRFIRSEEDDMNPSWEQRLVKRYYDKLFKEYCIADMSQYKSGKIGLRWRTEKEVISGKGQFICGNKQCSEQDGLASYEVNFSYFEAGENKQALVKLVACKRCAEKLMYKKKKEREQLEKKEKEIEKEKHKRKRERTSDGSTDDECNRSNERRRKGQKASTSTNETKADVDENFEEFLEGMFP